MEFDGAAYRSWRPVSALMTSHSIPSSWYGSLTVDQQDASGFLYRRNRYYDPEAGNFTQQDPIGIAGGLNLYGYANGDPINFSDPFGLSPCDDELFSNCPTLFDLLRTLVSNVGVMAMSLATIGDEVGSLGASATAGPITQSADVDDRSVTPYVNNVWGAGASFDLRLRLNSQAGPVESGLAVGLGRHLGVSVTFARGSDGSLVKKDLIFSLGTPGFPVTFFTPLTGR